MPTRNVSLTKELDHFVARKAKIDRYENASEVFRAALRSLEREEQEFEAKIADLRAAVRKSQKSGLYHGDPFERLNDELDLPSARQKRKESTEWL